MLLRVRQPAEDPFIQEEDEGADQILHLVRAQVRAERGAQALQLQQQRLLQVAQGFRPHPALEPARTRGGLGGQGPVEELAHVTLRDQEDVPMLQFHACV